MTTATTRLASYFSALRPQDAPAERIVEMKRLLLDYLGVTLAGSRTKSGTIVADFVCEVGGVAEASVIGRGTKVPMLHAAFANAVASHSVELDDVDDLALFHFSPPVFSAALAVAQRQRASGAQFLAAALAGCEMMARVSNATNPTLRNRGFHTTPTCGVFGAAVAAGVLLHLDAPAMTSAIALAGAQASGLMEMYGVSMQKRINPGPAARNGVVAAQLAHAGFTGADTILEGQRGFGAAFAGELDTAALLDGLGEHVPVSVEYKPYASARPIHNAIDCALNLRRQHGLRPDQVRDLTVFRHPDWAHYHVIQAPRTYHEAQMSLPYSVAVALADGTALLAQYSDERLRDEAVMSLSRRVEVRVDPSLPRGVSCRMVVTTVDGETLTAQVDDPKGSIGNPMTDEDLAQKFSSLAGAVLTPDRAEEVINAVSSVEKLADICTLIDIVAEP